MIGAASSTLHQDLWGDTRPVVGMVHLAPLPGAPAYGGGMGPVLDQALRDARALARGGVDGVLVENFGDAPFFPTRVPPETVAAMAVVVREVVRSVSIPVGVNVLRNDGASAMAVAACAGATFIRVNVHCGSMYTDQGLLQGQAHRTLRMRTALGPEVMILADVMVKHATPPPGLTLESAARDTWFRGKADGIIITGIETGKAVEVGTLTNAREALPPTAKLWVGSGVGHDSPSALVQASDGLIVGSALEKGGVAGAGVDPRRVRRFMESLGRI